MPSTFVRCTFVVVAVLCAVAHSAETISACITVKKLLMQNNVTNKSTCGSVTAAQVKADLSRTSPLSANLRLVVFNATNGSIVKEYDTLSNWTQTVLTAFVFSLPDSRNMLFVQCEAVITSSTSFALANSTTTINLVDEGAALLPQPPYVFDGYLMDTLSILGRATSSPSVSALVAAPAQLMSAALTAGIASGINIVTMPPRIVAYGYFGAMYRIDPANNTQINTFLLSIGRFNNLRVRVVGNLSVTTGLLTLNAAVVDLAAGDTPVPSSTLPNAVTQAPITATVLSWYIYLFIGLGVVGILIVCFCLAKRGKLKREDKKKTAKYRKREEERFEKAARELRAGIEVDVED